MPKMACHVAAITAWRWTVIVVAKMLVPSNHKGRGVLRNRADLGPEQPEPPIGVYESPDARVITIGLKSFH